MAKIAKQKGPIDCTMKTMKTLSRAEINRQDAENDKKRLDGQTLKFNTPKV
jgi:hypothetical protein